MELNKRIAEQALIAAQNRIECRLPMQGRVIRLRGKITREEMRPIERNNMFADKLIARANALLMEVEEETVPFEKWTAAHHALHALSLADLHDMATAAQNLSREDADALVYTLLTSVGRLRVETVVDYSVDISKRNPVSSAVLDETIRIAIANGFGHQAKDAVQLARRPLTQDQSDRLFVQTWGSRIPLNRDPLRAVIYANGLTASTSSSLIRLFAEQLLDSEDFDEIATKLDF